MSSGSPASERACYEGRMKSLIAVIATAALLGATCAAPAHAARPLTQAEKRGIARAIEFLPAKCIKGQRSTIDPRYAVAYNKNRGSCPRGDGFIAVKRIRGGWRELGQGSGGTCAEFRRYIEMPARIMRELRICGR
jgi:hypothetical protein